MTLREASGKEVHYLNMSSPCKFKKADWRRHGYDKQTPTEALKSIKGPGYVTGSNAIN